MPTIRPGFEVPDEVPEPIPAATVVVLRDGPDGVETLLLRRNAALEFAGGMWVFPGGRVDDEDRWADDGEDEEPPARRAAVREALEEAAVVLAPASLVWFSHWTPPPVSIKRYATWFFAAPAPDHGVAEVTIDGGEIHEHVWARPADALARRNALEIELAPPTWITLEQLARFATVDEALAGLAADEPERFATRFALVDDGAVALYHGDVAYDDDEPDPTTPGARHRLWMLSSGWRYERDGWS